MNENILTAQNSPFQENVSISFSKTDERQQQAARYMLKRSKELNLSNGGTVREIILEAEKQTEKNKVLESEIEIAQKKYEDLEAKLKAQLKLELQIAQKKYEDLEAKSKANEEMTANSMTKIVQPLKALARNESENQLILEAVNYSVMMIKEAPNYSMALGKLHPKNYFKLRNT